MTGFASFTGSQLPDTMKAVMEVLGKIGTEPDLPQGVRQAHVALAALLGLGDAAGGERLFPGGPLDDLDWDGTLPAVFIDKVGGVADEEGDFFLPQDYFQIRSFGGRAGGVPAGPAYPEDADLVDRIVGAILVNLNNVNTAAGRITGTRMIQGPVHTKDEGTRLPVVIRTHEVEMTRKF